MSGAPNLDGTGSHLVPPPPPRGAGPKKRRKKQSDGRIWMWPVGFGVGIALGIVAYQFVPEVDFYFDYWLALLAS